MTISENVMEISTAGLHCSGKVGEIHSDWLFNLLYMGKEGNKMKTEDCKGKDCLVYETVALAGQWF